MSLSRPVRIAVVGDVVSSTSNPNPNSFSFCFQSSYSHHSFNYSMINGTWKTTQKPFISYSLIWYSLQAGDFGNENVELVRSISSLEFPKAAILGNHDCWRTHQFSRKKVDRVQLQLECLGEYHVGYCRLDFPSLNLSVVGGRPFSCGGDRLFRHNLLIERYGVKDMVESAKKIYEAVNGTPDGHSVILLGHNGPTGLGSDMNDICGRDWVYGGGDHGDPDLAQAISDLKNNTEFAIPLVVFGHMHNQLQYGNTLRKMVVVGDDNTVYLNGALVPRVKYDIGSGSGGDGRDQDQLQTLKEGATLRAFTLIEILDGRVEKISQTWVLVAGDKYAVESENILFTKM